jgi:multisubunit Na+/H+ antiporter MnhF subunit
MNVWLLVSFVLASALAPPVVVCAIAAPASGLAAFEVAVTVATSALLALAEGLHRQPFVDLAFVLALVEIVGALAFARMMERHT